MTIDSGYPDWQRVADWSGSALVDQVARSYAVSVIDGPFYVGLWHGVQVTVNATVNDQSFVFIWYQDEAGTKPIGQRVIDVGAGKTAIIAFPNQGPWLRISCAEYGTGNGVHTLRVIATNRHMTGVSLESVDPLVSLASISLGAGIASEIPLFRWYTGPAHLWVLATDQPGAFGLRWRTASGTLAYFWNKACVINQQYETDVLIPPCIVTALVQNTGSATAVFFMSLVPDYFRP